MASQSSLLGAAGEHFVMSELLRRGYIAALAPQGVPTADIVVTDQKSERLCAIQVKARRELGSDGGWHMKAKHEGNVSDRLFYCFVDFGGSPDAVAKIYVIPSICVANVLVTTHQKWLSNPGRGGKPHKDSVMRRLLPDYGKLYQSGDCPYPSGWMEQYRNAWERLNLDASAVEAGEDE